MIDYRDEERASATDPGDLGCRGSGGMWCRCQDCCDAERAAR